MIKQWWQRFHEWINGAPSEYISILLITTAAFGIFIALFAPAEFKAILLAYWWFP